MSKVSNILSICRERIWQLIEKYKFYIFIILVTGISLYMRLKLIKFESGDYQLYLSNWFDQLKNNGGLKALGLNIGDYNTPYLVILALLTYIPKSPLYMIKLVTIFFDYVCAIMGIRIVSLLLRDSKNKNLTKLLVYTIIVCLPTMIFNGACWAQADSIYTTFVLVAVYYLIRNNYTKAFVFLGIAFSFKLQTIFILPMFILVYISERKFSALNFFIIPIINIIMCIPSMICGKSFFDCMLVYINQSNSYSEYISMNFPNVYSILLPSCNNLINVTNEIFPKIGMLYTVIVFVVLACITFYKKIKFSKITFIEFSIWSILIATFTLPRMHDRYLFLADVLIIIYAVTNKKILAYAMGIQIISFYTYIGYLFNANVFDIKYIGLLYFILLICYSIRMIKTYFICNNEEDDIQPCIKK